MPEFIREMFIFDGKWLGEIFSGLKIRYDDRKTHENRVEKMILCRSVCIVISSL